MLTVLKLSVKITKRGSWIWGQLVESTRFHLPAFFHFTKLTTAAAKASNRNIYLKLMIDDAFHHKARHTIIHFAPPIDMLNVGSRYTDWLCAEPIDP